MNADYYTTGTGDQTNDAPQSSYNNHVIKKCFFFLCFCFLIYCYTQRRTVMISFFGTFSYLFVFSFPLFISNNWCIVYIHANNAKMTKIKISKKKMNE